MAAVSTLVPVFFMMALGIVCKRKNWITPDQKDGIGTMVLNILFPFMIFNVLFTSTIERSSIFVVAYVLAVFLLAFVVGKLITPIAGKKFSHIIPFMLPTVEGGNIALPLYVSIAGMSYAINPITFDIAGVIVSFAAVPILVAKAQSGNADPKALLKKVFTSPFVIALIAGIVCNALGLYKILEAGPFIDLYENIITYTTNPIVGMILFVLGYNLNIRKSMIGDILKLLVIRFIYYALVIAGFFMLFSDRMQDKNFLIAVFIYFMSPLGLGTTMMIAPLSKSSEDEDFKSAFVSAGLFITLIVYTIVVVFIA